MRKKSPALSVSVIVAATVLILVLVFPCPSFSIIISETSENTKEKVVLQVTRNFLDAEKNRDYPAVYESSKCSPCGTSLWEVSLMENENWSKWSMPWVSNMVNMSPSLAKTDRNGCIPPWGRSAPVVPGLAFTPPIHLRNANTWSIIPMLSSISAKTRNNSTKRSFFGKTPLNFESSSSGTWRV